MTHFKRGDLTLWLLVASTVLFLTFFDQGFYAEASEKIGGEKELRLEAVAQESELEQEAYNSLIQAEEYQRLRAEQRQARLEAIKLLMQKKRRRRFSEIVTCETFYDTNYFREDRGSMKGTTAFHVIPTTYLDLGGDRIQALIRYTPGIEVPTRFNESKNKRYYQDATANLEFPIGKRTFVREYYRLFRGLDRATTESTNFSLRTENQVNSEVEYFLSKKFSFAFEHNWQERHFTARTSDNKDSREHGFLPRFIYYLTPKTSIFVQGGGGKTLGGNDLYNSTNWRMTVGLSGRLTTKSAVFANFGFLVKKLSEHPQFVNNYKGPFLELIYLYRTGKRFLPELRIVAGSSTENSFVSQTPLFQAQHFELAPRIPLSTKFSIPFHGGIQFNRFQADKSASLAGDDNNLRDQRTDVMYNFGYGVDYKVGRHVSIILSNDFYVRSSNLAANNYRQTVYKASLVLKF